jgi:hypothetical protein
MNLNPRVLWGSLGDWVDKKVTIGLTNGHWLTGQVREVAGRTLQISVGGKVFGIPAHEVSSIAEAPAFVSEYIK